MNTTRLTDTRQLVLSIVLSGGIFAVDLSLPLGVAGGVPYVIVVLASLWSPRRRDTYFAAGAGTTLTVLGYFLSAPGGTHWMVLANRFLALGVIWVTALLALRHKSADQDLRESELRFRQLAENIDHAFWLTDWVNRTLLYVSPAYETLFGRSCRSLYEDRHSWTESIHPEEKARVAESFAQSAERGEYVEEEYRIVDAEGRTSWIRDRAFPIRDEEGTVYRIVGLAEDVTERKRAQEALQASEAKYRSLVESANAVLWKLDLTTERFTYIGRQVEQLLGYPADSWVDMGTWSERIHSQDRDQATLYYKAATSRGEAHDFEYRALAADGRIVWIRDVVTVITGDHGPSELIGFMFDITKRKQAEEALRESERRLRSVLDGLFEAPIGLCFLDCELRYVFINEWLAKLNGTSVDGHLGRTIREVLPALAAGAESQLRHVLETGEPVIEGTVEAETPAAPGRKHVFQHDYYPVLAAEGAVVGVSCAVQDVTERKRVEEALQLSERRYRELIDALPHGIEECDLEGTIKFSSPGNDRLKGYDLGEVVGQKIWDFSVSEEAARGLQRWVRRLASEQPAPTPWIGQIKLRDERPLDVQVDWNYKHADDGRLTGFVSVITDITARRRAEAQVHKQREELAHMSRLSTMGEMATGFAHELNQPLASIVHYTSGCVQRIEAGKPDLQELVAVLNDASSEAQRAGEIIKRIRRFVQKRDSARTTIDIPELIRQVLDLMRYDLMRHGIQTRLEVEEHMPTLQGDRIQLQQVLLNLLRNSVEAMHGTETKQHRLTVGATTDNGDSVTLFVRDTGCGLGEVDPDSVFEPFYTTKEDGMGMGLAISRTIIEAHGGRLWATGNADGGCTFRFSFPQRSKARVGR